MSETAADVDSASAPVTHGASDASLAAAPAGHRAPALSGDTRRLERWLGALQERKASDLLLVSGAPPIFRIDGKVVPMREEPLAGQAIEDAVFPALPAHARQQYRDTRIARLLVPHRAGSAASASTCTTSAAGRRPRSGRCRCRCRA